MDAAAMIIGYLVMGVSLLAAVALVGQILLDAIFCGRFIWRVRSAVIASGEKISDRHLFRAWFRYWVGADYRPRYLILKANDKTVYWPGQEGTRRYPG